MPFPDDRFSAAVCFTMLHHVPSREQQDRLFAEALRVLRPGAVFAGSDSQLSLRFRLYHVFDTMVVVDPATLPDRLEAAGFTDIAVHPVPGSLRFHARKPSSAA
jgi:SAM-dependent methyltransferase